MRLNIGNTHIDDTFAEAFDMKYTRLIVTAADEHWLDAAVRELTGYSASVIACDAECGVERWLSPAETPDGRRGAAVLIFGFSRDTLAKSTPNRVGQCVMTCPTTAVFNGLLDAEATMPLGKTIRYFGDGYQKSKKIADERFWRIPVMDGEFLVADTVGVSAGVGGGNLILQGGDNAAALAAARRAAQAVFEAADVIAPFPGGVARSGSKVGSRYQALPASTADAYCPSLRGRVTSKLHDDANCCYEVVIDGASAAAVGGAMAEAMRAGAGDGVVAISAGNYGGKLGKHHFHLRQLA
jgi:formylmethanofuran--tetrahydromethanopterin N-formyltransferase